MIIPNGTKIRFTKDLTQGSTSETPPFIFAREGDTGIVESYHERAELKYCVKNDNWHNGFYADESEFEVIE